MQALAKWLLLFVFALTAVNARPDDQAAHPFILWNDADVKAIRKRITDEPWAQKEAIRLFRDDLAPANRRSIDNLFRYAILGDDEVVAVEKQMLLDFIAAPPFVRDSFDWQWHHVDHYEMALRYDVLYNELTESQRKVLDQTFRQLAVHGIKHERIREWESYPRLASHSICGLVTRDKRIIKGLFECPGGIRDYLDSLLDGRFSRGNGNPSQKNLGHLMLWCRGVQRLGLGEYGFDYKSKTGGSVKSLLSGMIDVADPTTVVPNGSPYVLRSAMRDTGIYRGRAFDMPAPRDLPILRQAPLIIGHLPGGSGGFPHWSGSVQPKQYDRFMPGEVRMHLPLVLEIAHQQWPDAGFDYLLAHMRDPGEEQYTPSLYWGCEPIDPSEAKPPAVTSAVYEQRGIALLRAEEGGDYLTSPAPMVALQLAHGPGRNTRGSYLSLQGFTAFNRPLYRSAMGETPHGDRSHWLASARAHNTVAVDNLLLERVVQDGQYVMVPRWPKPVDSDVTSSFGKLTRFVDVKADGTYAGVTMQRQLLLTDVYLFDVFHVSSSAEKPRTFHWITHAYGSAQPDTPDNWLPTDELNNTLGPASPDGVYEFIDPQRRDVDGATWSLTTLQTCATDPATSQLGKAWYDQRIGVHLTMLGEPDTVAFHARTPDTLGLKKIKQRRPQPEDKFNLPERDRDYDKADKGVTELDILPPKPQPRPEPNQKQEPEAEEEDEPEVEFGKVLETGGVSVIAQREGTATTFVAVHEPFRDSAWQIATVERVAQTDHAVAVRLRGKDGSTVNDRVLVQTGKDRDVTLEGSGESFTFKGFAFVRIAEQQVHVEGRLKAMRLKVKGEPSLHINGKPMETKFRDGVLIYGGDS